MNLFIDIDVCSIKLGLFLALDNIFADITVSTPDLSSAETILNMPKRNPMTSRLIDLNADCILIILKPTIRAAPISKVKIGISNLPLPNMMRNNCKE